MLRLVFEPNSAELATATEFLVQSALQQWLADVVEVQAVEVSSVDSTLQVAVRYQVAIRAAAAAADGGPHEAGVTAMDQYLLHRTATAGWRRPAPTVGSTASTCVEVDGGPADVAAAAHPARPLPAGRSGPP